MAAAVTDPRHGASLWQQNTETAGVAFIDLFFFSPCLLNIGSPSGGFFEQTGHNEVAQPF